LTEGFAENMQVVETAASDFEESLQSEEGKELKLASDQLQEYHRIKQTAGAKTAPLRQQLEQLTRQAAVKKVT